MDPPVYGITVETSNGYAVPATPTFVAANEPAGVDPSAASMSETETERGTLVSTPDGMASSSTTVIAIPLVVLFLKPRSPA